MARVRHGRCMGVGLALALAAAPAWAAGDPAPVLMPPGSLNVPLDRALDDPSPLTGGGKYVGVVPGPDSKNPLPQPRPEPTHLVWTGFRISPEGSQVFFQTTKSVSFDVVPGKGKVGVFTRMSVFLRNCRIHLSNNRRNLDTRFFATPVTGVSARHHRKDVEIRISLKEPSIPTPHTEAGADGTQFVILSFPAVVSKK